MRIRSSHVWLAAVAATCIALTSCGTNTDVSKLDACKLLSDDDLKALDLRSSQETGPGTTTCEFQGVGSNVATAVALPSGDLYDQLRPKLDSTKFLQSQPSIAGLPAIQDELPKSALNQHSSCTVLVTLPNRNGVAVFSTDFSSDDSVGTSALCSHSQDVAAAAVKAVRSN